MTQDEVAKDAAKAKAAAETKEEKSEKRPHTPRSGLVLKTSDRGGSSARGR